MRVDVVAELPPTLLDAAWRFYHDTFDELRTRAVARHVMYRHEFDELMADKRVMKYVAGDGDAIVGLAAQTDDLHAVPLISPEYFAHRWPDRYAQRRIFYAVFVGARPGPRGMGVFVTLLREMMRPITAVAGIVTIDVCTHNEAVHALPQRVELILGRIAGAARAQRVDSQSFWCYEFPAAS
ncbi:hypothetical protein EV385_0324 [Krasilnikovia cinnamomea]|uniref:N-acetyltransferase domain-containing protein n=1 Tax=Krasilnikovia cinnamomea TaxID=349313 RepID=A0A4Q7ZD47_9ACTN|nr:hypothetical protein [Krasilnikovia cinnamomea]RZU48607.1 hypothetical protein EV385_0324 [Krasilnikovia cinnamomea]